MPCELLFTPYDWAPISLCPGENVITINHNTTKHVIVYNNMHISNQHVSTKVYTTETFSIIKHEHVSLDVSPALRPALPREQSHELLRPVGGHPSFQDAWTMLCF